jgi:RNA polymerase sigma factor (sigma-70 family)
MAVSPATLLQHLRRLAAPPAADPTADAVLLDRFVRTRDEAAFAALVARHGPMVLRVCRRVLADPHAADDAFQATFLVLARKAGALRRPQALTGWLYGVGYRVAHKARVAAARRRRLEAPAADVEPVDPRPDPLAALSARELLAVVDEEVRRLPEVYRLPVLLCCLEGRSQEEAARLLGCTPGSVKGRLERGRARLHARLVRRGLALSAALAAVEVSRAAVGTGVPAPLEEATVRVASAFAAGQGAGVSAPVAALAEGWLKVRAATRLTLGALLLVAAGVVLVGTGGLAYQVLAGKQPRPAPEGLVQPDAGNGRRARPEGDTTARADRYGDPLPPGALARLGTVRFRHPGQIDALALSPDGKTLATGGYPGRIWLWDAATGRPAGKLQGPPGHVLALQFSPDGRLLAAAGSIDAAQVEAGRTVLLDLGTGKPRHTLEHLRWARCVAFSPDGTTLAVGCDQDGFGTWDVATGKAGPPLPGNLGAGFASIAFSPDGRLLAAGGYDKAVRLWDWRGGKEVGRLDAGSIVRSLAFSADGKTLLTGQDGPQFVQLWDVAARRPFRDFKGHKGWKGGLFPGSVYSVTFSPDGRTVTSGGDDGAVFVWDAATAEVHGSHQDGVGSVHGVAFLPDGKTLAAAGTVGRVELLDPATGKERPPFDEHTAGLADMALSPDGKLLATASADQTIRLWDLTTGRTVRVLRGHTKGVLSVGFAPDGRSLVSGGSDGTVRLWDVGTGEGRQLTDAHDWYARAAFAPDGKLLASAGADSLVRLWDPAAGRELGRLKGHAGYIVGLEVSPDGRWLATTGESYSGQEGLHDDTTIRIWDVEKRAESRQFTRNDHYSGPLHFSPDGLTFVYDDGGTLHFVDLATGDEPRPPAVKEVADFTFAAGGQWLVSLGKDRAIRLRELASGLELHRLAPPDCGMSRVVMAPGDVSLLTLNEDGTVLVWDLSPPGWRGRETPEDPERLWEGLANTDGPTAYRAVWGLAAVPGRGVATLRERLPRSVSEVAARGRRIRGLIADLDSDSFDRRAAASKELAGFGAEAEPALRRALATRPSAEARKRLEELLSNCGSLRTAEVLRCLRALAVLERIGTPEARQVLGRVAEGAAEDWLTEEAKAALRRLARRQAASP